MEITITLTLTEQEARVFRSWASVGRYCDSICRAIEEADPEGTNAGLTEVHEDTLQLKPVLSSLHYQIRQKLVEMGVKPLWPQG